MRCIILIFAAAVLINFANAMEYDEVDLYDDFDEKARSISEDAEDEIEPVRPNYDIKDAAKLFIEFVNRYKKEYKTEEEYKHRYANFLTNLEEIIANNKAGGESVWDINMFTDYSDEEIAKHG